MILNSKENIIIGALCWVGAILMLGTIGVILGVLGIIFIFSGIMGYQFRIGKKKEGTK